MLGLFLVACERPLPTDGSTAPEATPAEAYPAPAEAEDAGSPAADEPPTEGYPLGEEDEPTPPAEEAESIDAYPGGPGNEALGEQLDGATAAGETLEGEAAEGELTEGEAGDGEQVEGEAAQGEAAEGETGDGEQVEGEAAEGETVEGSANESIEEAAMETGRTHTVGAGETLFQIGMQYGMSWVVLAEANGITNPDSLYLGQVLVIPDVEDLEQTEETAEAADDAAEATEAEEPAKATEETTYIVQFGDTLYSISVQYDVTMMDIARANELPGFDQIYAGQELIIPRAETEEEADAGTAEESEEAESSTEGGAEGEAAGASHVVQENETVFTIAFKYGIIWTQVVEANELESPYTLEVGQTLVIPASE